MKKLLLIPVLLASFAGASATASETFEFEVTTTSANQTFSIPLSGFLDGAWGKPYAWNITWGDNGTQTADSADSGAPQNASGSPGIPHTYAAPGTYTITLTPAGSDDAWLAAFGFYSGGAGANAPTNKNRLTKLVSPLTPLMTRTSAQLLSGAAPSYEWAYTFYNCQNLAMGDGFAFSPGWDAITTVGSSFAASMFRSCSGAAFAMNGVFNLPAGITAAGSNFADSMFRGCSGASFTMNSVFNLPAGITAAGNDFAYEMFQNCSGASFTMNGVFNLPAGITAVGDNFAYEMFRECYGSAFNMNGVFNLSAGITAAGSSFAAGMFSFCYGSAFAMNSVFNLPAGITTVGSSFADSMFYGCSSASFTMNSVFNLPAGIIAASHYFANQMFRNCSGAAFNMNGVFNLPTGITSAGNYFAASMFYQCYGASFTMNGVFNLPTGITAAGNNFAASMFYQCYGAAFNMNGVFNLPTGITAAGNYFANSMFSFCSGASFTMNSVFNLPAGITAVGDNFAYEMFLNCSGDSFTMNSVLNLPTGITAAGGSFAYGMLRGCSGAAFNMNGVFNLPTGITAVGNYFANHMFQNCSGAAFTMNSVFNLPAGITTVGSSFASSMFDSCSGAAFQVNDVFVFPLLDSTELSKGSVFANTFSNLGTASPQNRTATSIINGNGVPSSTRYTFTGSGCFADHAYIHTNWGGGGQNADNLLVVSHSSITFPSETEGYAPVAAWTVTVRNFGAITITGVSLDPALATDFDLGPLSNTTLLPGGSVTFTVAPQDNLPVGAHAGTITIGATGCAPQTLDLSFTVLARDDSFDIPDWDGSGIRITAFTVTSLPGGEVAIDLDAVCGFSLDPAQLQLLTFEDLSNPAPWPNPPYPDGTTSHPSAFPPHHRAAWHLTLPSAPPHAFFRVTHED